MPALVLIAIILALEFFTHKSALELAMPVLKKMWSAVDWMIAFLLRMNEPMGDKS